VNLGAGDQPYEKSGITIGPRSHFATRHIGHRAQLWTCPACTSQVAHSDAEPIPRSGATYRCHVCRLELRLDSAGQRLTVAPLPVSPPADGKRRIKRNNAARG